VNSLGKFYERMNESVLANSIPSALDSTPGPAF
jgi:hypothetical protein